ncbi:MAG: CbiX/SirB N-terminal domain-containing protein [Azonexus sp.]|nr:CbiX/SirB N-terminal domain-containing protein [Azonexus sp.]
MSTSIILFAHGARDPEWASPLRRVQETIALRAPDVPVELAFLEFMSPDLPACVARLIDAGSRDFLVLPMFIAQGGHLKRDLPALIEQLRSTWPEARFSLAEAVGESPEVVQAMAAVALRKARLAS